MAPQRPIEEAKLKTLAALIVDYEAIPRNDKFHAITRFLTDGLKLGKKTYDEIGIGYSTVTRNATLGNQVHEDDRKRIVASLRTWAEKQLGGPIKASDYTPS